MKVRSDARPPFGTPEWLTNFKEIVNSSQTRNEAVKRLGYATPTVIYYHLKKLGIHQPPQWKLKPEVSRQRRNRVPEVILPIAAGRAWVACLMQGEGLIGAKYARRDNTTSLQLRAGMTDEGPIFLFCDLTGIKRPKKHYPRARPHKPVWVGTIAGLRAFRVLQEILPYLTGEKLKEAKRALAFFAPDGYRMGKHGGYDIWPPDEFPLRKRGPGTYMLRLRGAFADSHEDFEIPSGDRSTAQELDRSCIRIAEVLLAAGSDARSLVEIMDETGLAWRTVILHLRHLEGNSFATKAKISHVTKGPRLLYRANQRLVDVRDGGWILDPE